MTSTWNSIDVWHSAEYDEIASKGCLVGMFGMITDVQGDAPAAVRVMLDEDVRRKVTAGLEGENILHKEGEKPVEWGGLISGEATTSPLGRHSCMAPLT